MYVCLWACAGTGAHGYRKISDPLEVELQVVVSWPTLVPETKLGSSARVVCTLYCSGIPLAPQIIILKKQTTQSIPDSHIRPDGHPSPKRYLHDEYLTKDWPQRHTSQLRFSLRNQYISDILLILPCQNFSHISASEKLYHRNSYTFSVA